MQGGKSEPGCTTKVPSVICSIRRDTPRPCSSLAESAFRINRSRVPWSRLALRSAMMSPLSNVYTSGSERRFPSNVNRRWAGGAEPGTPGALQAQRDDEKPPSRVDAFIRLQSNGSDPSIRGKSCCDLVPTANARVTALDRASVTPQCLGIRNARSLAYKAGGRDHHSSRRTPVLILEARCINTA